MNEIWKELFEYWQKDGTSFPRCVGAKEEQIIKLKTSIDTKVPEVLIESLMCCNSYPEDFSKVKSSCLYLGNGNMLLDIDSIIEIYKDGIEYGYIENRNWIPIFDYNGDIFVLLSSIENNIIYVDMEFGVKKIIFDSYNAFLEHIKFMILTKGSFSYKDLS